MDYSQITDDIFIGTTPLPEDYDILRKQGVTLVINMRIERRPYPDPHNAPMGTLWLRTFDSPLIPIPLSALERGVLAGLRVMTEGGKVYIHCAAGVHRSVAMAACILIAQGREPVQAMSLIKQRRSVADPEAWYIRRQIMRFAVKWDGKV